MLGHALALMQLAHEQRLLDRREGMGMGAREPRDQRIRQVAGKGLHPRRVPPQPLQGGDAPIAIDQDQASIVPACNDKTRHELAAAIERAGQRLHGAGGLKAQVGIAQVQAVDIAFAVSRVTGAVMRIR